MKTSGWGNHPIIEAKLFNPENSLDLLEIVSSSASNHLIPRGLGRSYGDSSLSNQIIECLRLDHFSQFDPETGELTCGSGVSLADILETFVPKGWFLPVTPGTKFVTIGGAIASDVHGKNHHVEGSFSDHILSLKIVTGNGEFITCSRESNPDLFLATCSGMGLTGTIVEATLKLKPIASAYIKETLIKAPNLEQALNLFEDYEDTTYSVAWIDCLSTGDSLGRSLLMLGEHDDNGPLITGKSAKLAIPFNMPGFLLNKYSIQAFNTLYYNKVRNIETRRNSHYDPYFYPLDGIHQWNKMYGKNGFTQYQFVLPKSAGLEGMTEVLNRIAESKKGSFLAVLKAFGKGNENYLSFPMEGYTLALDFKLEPGLFDFLNRLDDIVLSYGGRLYMSKDVRMSESVFKESYPLWEKFQEVRTQYGSDKIFNSLQSKRLGLTP